jgi:chemotaxis protein methyltransferase CheR
MAESREVSGLKQLEADTAGFAKLTEYLRRESGIYMPLSIKNQTLLAGRMCKLLAQTGIKDYHELYAALVGGKTDVKTQFISAITTNTTHFFRENVHFEVLSKVVREISQTPQALKTREMRIWCAACSSGEEAYSIAMVVRNILPLSENWNIRILATDIDNEIVRLAARGVYPMTALESVPEEFAKNFFDRGSGGSANFVRVRKKIRELVTFANFNLMTPVYPFQFKFDVVFCRNVMIYFDKPEIQETIRKLENSLRTGGYLFLGHSETIMGSSPSLKSRAAACYEKIPAVRKGDAA